MHTLGKGIEVIDNQVVTKGDLNLPQKGQKVKDGNLNQQQGLSKVRKACQCQWVDEMLVNVM